MDLNTDVVYLKGVGPQRAELLGKELGIKSLGDLLEYYPFRYVDRSHVGRIDALSGEEGFVVLKGVISGMQEVVSGKGAKRLSALFRDRSGEMELTWFQGI